jgi:N-acetylneuraminic acid mutarotase
VAGSGGAPVAGSGGNTPARAGSGGMAPGGSGGRVAGGAGGTSGGATATAGVGGANAGTPGAAGSGATAGGGSGSPGTAGSGNAGASGNAALGMPKEEALPDLDAVRQEHSVVALDGIVYVIGGYVSNTNSASVLAYDPSTKMYTSVADFPAPLNHGNAGALNGKVYVAGFYVSANMSTATAQTYAYDPAADAWTEVAPLPAGTDRGAGCVAVDGGYMYVIGGAHDGKSVDDVSRYDAKNDQWETLAKLPERREHCAAGAIGGVIYVGGGRVDGITGIEPKSWAYDPGTDEWTQKADLDPARGGLAGAVLHDRLVVFGGEGNKDATSGVFPDIDAYDPATDTWENLGSMLVPRHGYGAAVVGDRIYLMGGAIKQGGTPGKNSSVFYFE